MTIFRFFCLSVLSILLLHSCDNNANCIPIVYEEVFEFQRTDLFCPEPGVEIEIEDIIDMRCPCDVECVWEGEFIFNLLITSGGQSYSYELHEILQNEIHSETGLEFNNIGRLDVGTCEDMKDIDDMRFEMSISASN